MACDIEGNTRFRGWESVQLEQLWGALSSPWAAGSELRVSACSRTWARDL